MRISIKRDNPFYSNFEGDEYIIDLDRKFEGHEPGDLICYVTPFFSVPLTLDIAIRATGALVFRSWKWSSGVNHYLHTREKGANSNDIKPFERPFVPTAEQIDTVNGLFSGRIKFEGLKLAVGATVQEICPIDHKKEEQLTGKKIFSCIRREQHDP